MTCHTLFASAIRIDVVLQSHFSVPSAFSHNVHMHSFDEPKNEAINVLSQTSTSSPIHSPTNVESTHTLYQCKSQLSRRDFDIGRMIGHFALIHSMPMAAQYATACGIKCDCSQMVGTYINSNYGTVTAKPIHFSHDHFVTFQKSAYYFHQLCDDS